MDALSNVLDNPIYSEKNKNDILAQIDEENQKLLNSLCHTAEKLEISIDKLNSELISHKDLTAIKKLEKNFLKQAKQTELFLVHEKKWKGKKIICGDFNNTAYSWVYTQISNNKKDGFIEAGSGGGIAIGYTKDIQQAVIDEETLIDKRIYHTINESKNGLGPAPIYTPHGWLHLAHGVRNTAAGLRYVLYLFMTDLQKIDIIIYKPAE